MLQCFITATINLLAFFISCFKGRLKKRKTYFLLQERSFKIHWTTSYRSLSVACRHEHEGTIILGREHQFICFLKYYFSLIFLLCFLSFFFFCDVPVSSVFLVLSTATTLWGIPKFSRTFFLEISVPFDFHSWMSGIQFGWMVRVSDNFRIFWNFFPGNVRTICPSFDNFGIFGWMESAPDKKKNIRQEIDIGSESLIWMIFQIDSVIDREML